jgi:integrase
MGVKVRERKPGEWWLFIDHHGRRKAKKIGSREAAETAKTELEEALGKRSLGIRTKAETITFRKYAEQWMKGHVAKNLKPATVRDYRDTLDRFILPEFGAVPIDQIRREEIKALCFRILEKKFPQGTDEETGEKVLNTYSKSTAHHIARVMSVVISHAIEDRLLQVNPASRPGRFVKDGRIGEKADFLTVEEGNVLLEATRAHHGAFYPLLLTALRTGMRKGELRAVQWGDID